MGGVTVARLTRGGGCMELNSPEKVRRLAGEFTIRAFHPGETVLPPTELGRWPRWHA
jgi:hypothetical protein